MLSVIKTITKEQFDDLENGRSTSILTKQDICKAYPFESAFRKGGKIYLCIKGDPTVVGVCFIRDIKHYEAETYKNAEEDDIYESISEFDIDSDGDRINCYNYISNEDNDYKNNPLCKSLNMSWEELENELGDGFHDFSVMNIYNFNKFGKPNPISAFNRLVDGHEVPCKKIPKDWYVIVED